ncbi:major tail protein [Lactococcus lactis]|uniref:major tail protein n=1 Tax=Lactococcus lactis TaxID=1358 RepID=UPI00071E4CDC|nr:major tail protein [Lactococcus lactis]KST85943.1 Phage major tail protein [Lactococcus lactis subsp. lactis]
MATAVGFKQLTIRILNGEKPVLDDNIFIIKGDKNKGATSSAKISGLSPEVIKTYGSNKVYNISGKGTGDVKIDFDVIDIPEKIKDKILGYQVDEDTGVVRVTSDTQAPDCSVLLEDYIPSGEAIMLGFATGIFSYDGNEWNTKEEKGKELAAESLSFAAGSADDGLTLSKYVGDKSEGIAAVKSDLQMTMETP